MTKKGQGELASQTFVHLFKLTLLQLRLNDSKACHLLFRIHGLGGGFSVAPILTAAVEPCTSSNKVSIVGCRDNGDGTSGTTISVAHAVGQFLQTVRSEVVLIVQDVVVSGARSTLQTGMGLEICGTHALDRAPNVKNFSQNRNLQKSNSKG